MDVQSVFPSPYPGASPPNWTLAIAAAAVIVTSLWILAITALVVSRVLKGRSAQYDVSSGKSHSPQPHITHRRRHMITKQSHMTKRQLASPAHSLGTPPPPVQPPTARVGQPDWSQVEINPGYRESADSADDDPIVRSDSTVSAGSIVKKKPLQSSEETKPPSPAAASSGQPGMVLSRPITVRQLGATLREPGYIDAEFKKLPALSMPSTDCPPGAERKNRYSNVLPTPRTRVAVNDGDYINANYLRGHKGNPHGYIATQAPLPCTVAEFWSMVWENRSEVIVMATNFQERNVDKCCRYWPATGSESYGEVQVSVLSQFSTDSYNKTTLKVSMLGELRTVEHYRLMWPERGIPPTTNFLTDFLKEARLSDGGGPAVIHCSAGIGRTGVIAAVDIGLAALTAGEGKLDILRIVSSMRQDRAGCVQTKDQYRYIHQCLYDAARRELSSP